MDYRSILSVPEEERELKQVAEGSVQVESAVCAAGRKLVEFIVSDPDMAGMTEKEISRSGGGDGGQESAQGFRRGRELFKVGHSSFAPFVPGLLQRR